MADPVLVASDALAGVSVALSVSESADLLRLGLLREHCDFAVAEIARAVLLAGGRIVYGGRLRPEGFTQILMEEVRRYSDKDKSLTICLAESEHRRYTADELSSVDRRLGTAAELVLLDRAGAPIAPGLWSARQDAGSDLDVAAALSAMRRSITATTDARVVVGGKLTGFEGDTPGVVEEALLSTLAGQPLYVAGGFGGAAAAVARVLGRDDQSWAPPGFPAHADEEPAASALRSLGVAARPAVDDGLTDQERLQLASSHRPGDIATFLVLGLARTRSQTTET